MSSVLMALLTTVLAAEGVSLIPDALLREVGFSTTHLRAMEESKGEGSGGRPFLHVRYSGRRIDGVTLRLTVMTFSTSSRQDTVDADASATGFRGAASAPPSGLRLGIDCRFERSQGNLSLYVTTAFANVSCQFIPQAETDSAGFRRDPAHDYVRDIKLFERIARHTVARAAGSRLINFADVNLSGATVPGARCRYSNRMFGNLRRWCEVRGWSIEANDEVGYLMLRRGSRYAVVPLGTNAVKVDGQWFDLPDSVMERDGTVYVPRDVFERMNQ